MDAQKSDRLRNTVILTDRFPERRPPLSVPVNPYADADITPPLEPGERVDRYLILDKLGGGGMGVVYKAQDTELNRAVALKVLPRSLSRQGDFHARFRAEARAHARINSPHAVTLYSSLEADIGEVLVLEHVEGQTLAQRLCTGGPLDIDSAVDIFSQALLGLDHIHRMGVIHRDLKPSNIFLTRDGQVKLMDFGIAKLTDQHDDAQGRSMVGTLLYIAPEQINGRETDFRSDIYTLGISLFEGATGRLPFERRTDYALMHAHVQESPPRPKQFQRHLPPELEWVILKAIEKNPDRRFQTAAQFRDALLTVVPAARRARKLNLPDATTLHRELRRYRLVPNRQLLGGLAFDALLVGGVAVLLFGLGIVPFRSQSVPPPELRPVAAKPAATRSVPPHAPHKIAARTVAPAVPAKAASLQPAAKPRPATPAPAAPKDGFDALRNAWGG